MSCNYEALPHLGIRTLKPYIPGKSADVLAAEKGLTNVIKLASNENPLGCSPLALEAVLQLTKETHQIATYPMSVHHPVREKIAKKMNITTDMVILGNGSDSLFGLLLSCFALHTGRHVMTHDYAFSSYAIQAKTLGIPVVSTPVDESWAVDISAMIAACNEQTALIFIANPNNPTGLRIANNEIERLLKAIPNTTMLVLDEAYYEFDDKHGKSTAWLHTYPNLIITRTFSKAYGLAGFRLGYAMASPQITALLYRIQLPFAVNIVAMTAAFAALDDEAFISESIKTVKNGITQLTTGLDALGVAYKISSANFITIDCKTNGMFIYHALEEYGIIVRPLHPYGLDHYLRVSIGLKEQNERFLTALSLILKKRLK